MKDVIYLVVNANQVVRMTKTLPSLKRGEVPIKVSVSVDDNAFSIAADLTRGHRHRLAERRTA